MKPSSSRNLAVSEVTSTYAAFTLGNLTLIAPRDDIRTLEMVEDMEPTSPQDRELGWYQIQGERIPVYGLGEELEPLEQIPLKRRIAVVMVTSDAALAILCDDIAFLDEDKLSFREIPDCMDRRRPLITGLAIHEGGVACVTTSQRLATYFLGSCAP